MGATTHDLTIGDREVVKRYRSWDRGEPDREWAGLVLLHEHAPGLAPEPLARREVDGVPEVVMTRLPGHALGDGPLSEGEADGLAAALDRLHAAVPEAALAGQPERLAGPAELRGWFGTWDLGDPATYAGPVAETVDLARTWVESDEAARLGGPLAERSFGLADGNLANALWDGATCRWVDFEDAGVSDPAYEVADLLEHISVRLPGLLDPDDVVRRLGWTGERAERVAGFRRMFGVFWLFMLLPGGRAHHRNPPGTLEDQAAWTRGLLEGA
ncbi:phosphotransferase family protein [Nocardioides iriomotensis]|uniref:Aminoglycoside phosphotransferase family protein n=1 Tax=Nocardioides iriomotensis TaxID=715784 RepID=A0A4Q5IUH8_9ACTN|nr:aminoglycoside phosphotransferase family protein [Nocardioides iriomotensis]RYU08818.1 aminoglycoside phosphotransferase family protein [Nocardioides iriomotensis]